MSKNVCKLHIDEKNDTFFSEVIVFSTVVYDTDNKILGNRVSVICYTQQSINNFYIRENITIGPAVFAILQMYKKVLCCQPERMKLDKFLEYIRTLKPTGSFNNYRYVDFECNFDLSVFMSPLVSAIVVMITTYGIDLVEVISIIRAFAGMPNIPHYITMLLLFMVQQNQLEVQGDPSENSIER